MADRTPRRRSSLSVTLVLIGAAALGGCDDADNGPPFAQRDTYASLEDCQKDWGRPQDCEPVAGSVSHGSGTSSYGVRYYGPWYGATSSTTGPRPGSHATGAMSVSRDGFGSTAGLHSSGS